MENNHPITIEQLRLFICPLCHSEIPEMKLILSKASIEIKVNCLNSFNRLKTNTYTLKDYFSQSLCNEHGLTGVEFCISCSEWLCCQCISVHESNPKNKEHHYLSCESLLYCQKHNSQPLQYFSSISNKNGCFECSKNNKNTGFVLLKRPDLFIDNNKIAAIEKTNSYLKKTFITELNLNQEDLEIDINDIKLLKMKENIDYFYQKKCLLNANLLAFFKALETALRIMKPMHHYQLSKLSSFFQLNDTNQIVLNKTTLRGDYKALKAYFNNEFLFIEKIKLKKSMTHHSDWVCSLVSFNNNNKFASGGADNKIHVYNSQTLNQEATLKGHYLAVIYLIQLKDGRLVSSSDDSKIIVWNASSYQLLTSIKAHRASVYCLVQLHNNQIASCSGDSRIIIWDHHLFKCIATLEGHTLPVRYIVQLKDLTLASASEDNSIKIWDINTKQCKGTLSGITFNCNYLCLIQLPDTQLVSGTNKGSIISWDTQNYKANMVISIFPISSFRSLYLLNDRYLLSGSDDKKLRVWSLVTFQSVYDIEIHSDTVRCFATIGGNRLVTGSYDKSISIWDLNFLSST